MERRLRIALVAALVSAAAFHVALLAGMWSDPSRGFDLGVFTQGALRGATSGWPHLYDRTPPLPYLDMPLVAWVVWPLTWLPHFWQWVAWDGISLSAAVAASLLAVERNRRLWLLALLASIPLTMLLLVGQMTGLVVLAVAGAFWLLRRQNYVLAGVLLAVAIQLKPTTLALVPFALLVTRQWRVLGGLLIGSLAALAAYMATVGLDFPLVYWNSVHFVGTGVASLGAALPMFGPPLGYGDRLPVVLLAGWVLWRERDPIYAIGVGALASMLFTPYGQGYDLLVLFVVGWALQHRFGGRVAALGFAPLLVFPELTGWTWDVAGLVAGEIGLLVWLAWSAHHVDKVEASKGRRAVHEPMSLDVGGGHRL